MALPTARRPKKVEEELKEELVTKQREVLKLRTDPHKIFIDSMKVWYEGLNGKEKSRLTPKLLKTKAVSYCYTRKMIYDNLPLDWVKRLKNECGLKLHAKKKRNESEHKEYQNMMTDQIDPPSSPASSASSLFDIIDKEGKKVPKDDAVRTPIKKSSEPKPKLKKYLDLTNEPPPPDWLEAYAKGVVLPRILKTYSTEDTNIIFWDYTPSLVDMDGKPVILKPGVRLDVMAIKDTNRRRKFYGEV